MSDGNSVTRSALDYSMTEETVLEQGGGGNPEQELQASWAITFSSWWVYPSATEVKPATEEERWERVGRCARDKWLRENPDVVVKRTNTATGMVVGKKTEPNIIITILY